MRSRPACVSGSCTLSTTRPWTRGDQQAERGGGELLIGEPLKQGRPRKRSHDKSVSLKDLGLDRNDSSRWQAIARIPEAEFERRKKMQSTAKKLRKENPKYWTHGRIGAELGVPRETVRNWFMRNGQSANTHKSDSRVKIPITANPVILDRVESGESQEQIASDLGVIQSTISRIATKEKREHVFKMNLLRRHLEPLAWGKAFKKLLKLKGVKRGAGKRNDRTSVKVTEVAKELGVKSSTAEKRLKLSDDYDSLPPEEQKKVDAGKSVRLPTSPTSTGR